MNRTDAVAAVLVLGLAGLLGWQTGQVRTPPFIPIGPTFYPRVVLAVLALLAAVLLVQALTAPAPAGPAPTRAAAGAGGRRRWLVAACFGLFAGYTAALPWLGYRLSTALFVAATQWTLGPRTVRSLPGALLVGAGTAVATYLVFERYLRVLLPRGILFP